MTEGCNEITNSLLSEFQLTNSLFEFELTNSLSEFEITNGLSEFQLTNGLSEFEITNGLPEFEITMIYCTVKIKNSNGWQCTSNQQQQY